MPCDCLIVSGSAIVNEATLTGSVVKSPGFLCDEATAGDAAR